MEVESDNIQNYNVFEMIGQGGFGQVYRAKSKIDDREYAIKFIDRMALESNTVLKSRVANEVTLHNRLKHRCVLQLASYFEDENHVYMVLEYCSNKDLKTYLKSRKILTEEEVRKFMKQIICGLRYLDQHKILHRDITLANILLTSKNDVKIADFGLALKLDEPSQKDIGLCGTPSFIAPEVASRRVYGLEADIWSLGCVMYNLLVGRPLFVAESVKKTLERVINDKFDIPDWVSPEATKLMNAILRKNPKERPTLDEILNHPFFTRTPLQENHADYSKSKFGSRGEFSQDSGHDTLGTMSSLGSRTALSDHSRARQSRPTVGQQLRGNVESRAMSGSSLERTERSRSGPGMALKNHPHIPLTPQQCSSSIIMDSQPRPASSLSSYQDENAQVPSSSDGRQRNPRRPLASKNGGDVPRSLRHCSPSSDSMLEIENRPPRHPHGVGNSLPGKGYNQRKEHTASDSGYDNYTLENGSNYACSADISVARSSRENQTAKPGMHRSNSRPDVTDRGRSIERKALVRNDSSQQKTRSQSRTSARGEEGKKAEWIVQGSKSVGVAGRSKNENKSNHPESVLPPPINTARLRPQRQIVKFLVLSILDDGWVSLEFFKTNTGGEEWVTSVLKISPDGLKIEAFAPNGGKGYILQSQPPELLPKTAQHGFKQFSYDRLPKSYWKKYVFASHFANLVRSKTPKITYYIQEAKATLMENSPDPDLEVAFYDGVTVTKKSDETQIVLNDGSTLKLKDSYDVEDLPRSIREKYKTVIRVYSICRQVESFHIMLEEENGSSFFPVTINRRPIHTLQDSASKVSSTSEQLRGCTPSVTEGPSQIWPHVDSVFSNQSTSLSNGQLTHSYNQTGMSWDVGRGQQRSIQSKKR